MLQNIITVETLDNVVKKFDASSPLPIPSHPPKSNPSSPPASPPKDLQSPFGVLFGTPAINSGSPSVSSMSSQELYALLLNLAGVCYVKGAQSLEATAKTTENMAKTQGNNVKMQFTLVTQHALDSLNAPMRSPSPTPDGN